MMKDNLLAVTKQTLQQVQMLTPGDHLVVGVSGGADSMALLHVLLQLQESMGFSLIAAHVNHGLRGEESRRDQLFVETICREWGVPLQVEQADMLTLSRRAGEGVEEFSRHFRYAFFQQVAGRAGKIATAHTADDNAETVLLNLTRGTGLSGLCGIPPMRGNIIRPLIACSREMVEAYCGQNHIPFVTDSSNLQDDYRRNQIRHHVIPLLKKQNPSFLQAVTRMTEANAKDREYLFQQGEALLEQSRRGDGYELASLGQAEDVPLTYAVKALLQKESLGESAYHLQTMGALIRKGYGSCSLTGNRTAQVSGGVLRITVDEQKKSDFTRHIPLENGVYYAQGKQITLTVTQNQNVHNSVTYNLLDRDTIGTQLCLRNRRAGDKITLPGRCTKLLKKLLNEEKIPVWERASRLILADEQGVLWVEGIGCDARCCVTDHTQQILCVTVQPTLGQINQTTLME